MMHGQQNIKLEIWLKLEICQRST